MKVNVRHSAEMAAIHQHANVNINKLKELFPQYSQATVYRHAKRAISAEPHENKTRKNGGCPRKLSEYDCRRITRAIKRLRKTEGSFTSKRIFIESGITGNISNRTFRRALNRLGYSYRQTRKKGLMKESDFSKRIKFCRKIRKHKLRKLFWQEGIAFYMDGVGFEYKTNPLDQARAPGAREWRRSDEGLIVTSKGKKEGVKNCNFMVGISYRSGVVLCEPYSGSINSNKMVDIVDRAFPLAFRKSNSPRGRRVLMDGCPRQNSVKAFKAYDRVHAKMFRIPPRSPDLNPAENFFNLIKRELKKQAIQQQITKETMEEFKTRVKNLMENYPCDKIDKIIDTMDKRIDLILKNKGRRIKY